jgi:putative transposase
MTTPASDNRNKNYCFPAEIISHGVWLYFRFCLSYRDVEELLFARGIIVTYEAIRKWCRKFGQSYANELRRRRPRPGDKWHLDEVFLTIQGTRHYLWRAVDQDGLVLDILVQRRRNKKAAKKFFRKLLKGLTYVPRVIITDKLKSYGAAKQEILPGVEHRQRRYLNNRAENSHQPTRQRESAACRDLSHQGTPSAFSRPMVRSLNTSAHAGIGFLPRLSDKKCDTDSIPGRKSLPYPLQLKDSRLRPLRTCLPEAHVSRQQVDIYGPATGVKGRLNCHTKEVRCRHISGL